METRTWSIGGFGLAVKLFCPAHYRRGGGTLLPPRRGKAGTGVETFRMNRRARILRREMTDAERVMQAIEGEV